MKVQIIYFSQTGGTEKIAQKIKEGITESKNQCDLVKIKQADLTNLKDFDLIGIGCPTFFYREPVNIRNLIQKLPISNNQHIFIFATHGSCLGNTFYYMISALKEKGYLVIGGFDSYSDSSLQFYPSPMHTSGHPDEIELNEAKAFGRRICEISRRVNEGELSLIPQFELVTDTWWAKDSKLMTLEVLRKISPEFTINADKCIKCFTCQNECPGDAIDIEADPPEIQKDGCIFCWACEKICPEGAIEADWSSMHAGAQTNLRKYIKLLKAAEEEGKFRPHIDYTSIK